jgi:hypothetical protein
MATTVKTETVKKEKVMQFRVTTLEEGNFKPTNSRSEAISIIADLQQKNVSPIYLHDDKEEKTICYSKERYEQNYRIKNAKYAPAQASKTEEQQPPEE